MEGTYLKPYYNQAYTCFGSTHSPELHVWTAINSNTNQNKPQHPRTFSRRQFLKGSLATGAALGLGGLSYTWIGEPNWLEKVYISLELPNLPPSLNGMRLVQFSDMHLGMGKNIGDLDKLADVIMGEKPDLLCFTGDMVDEYASELNGGIAALQRMQAPLGKFAVLGNHDYLDDVLAVSQQMRQGGFQMLINENHIITRDDGVLAIAGLDDQLLGNPDVHKGAKGIPDDACRILLMHEPDYADRIPEELQFGLQLSGHSHGGQIRVPLVGAVITPKGSRKYVMGGYKAGINGHLPLYVNRGIGMSQLPVRFMCRPELTIFTLHRAST
ncbi:metallophosphoesterase [Paenibacillus sp. WLX2291]|uniref:metallophosphoesterase n=1 Tax=Paenibacillus sp. WLX2291 TaxID=3296934 RepID=UPI00398439F6